MHAYDYLMKLFCLSLCLSLSFVSFRLSFLFFSFPTAYVAVSGNLGEPDAAVRGTGGRVNHH